MSQEKYIYLIYQQIQGVLTPSEEEILKKWLKDSPENRKTQEEIVQSMSLMEDFKPSFSVDEEGDFAKISKELGFKGAKKSAKTIKMGNRRRWIGIAAAITLLLTAGLFFLNTPDPTLEWTAFEADEFQSKQITLPDGTVALLNKNSRLEYPKEFLGKDRLVKMKGEVFFKVKRDETKPFKISTRENQVTVLGTEFSVRDYEHENATTVTVTSGKVAFSDTENDQRVIMTANEAAVMDLNTKTITKQDEADPNALSYQSGKLVFRNTPLTKVFEDLAKHFDVIIDCQNEGLKNCKYSLTKQEVDLNTLLETLKTLYKIEFTQSGKKSYVIRGGGDC